MVDINPHNFHRPHGKLPFVIQIRSTYVEHQQIVLLYFGGMIVATVLEYITAWLMETIFHASWWDYSTQPYNLQGKSARLMSNIFFI